MPDEIIPASKNKKSIVKFILIAIFALFFGAAVTIGYYYIKIKYIDASRIKIGFVTDWEYNNKKDVGMKLTDKAKDELAKVVDYFNNEYHPDIVIGGGDMIESSGIRRPEKAKQQLSEMNEIYSKVQARREYLMGNHDLYVLTKQDVRSVIGTEENHKYFDLGDWRIILLDTNFNRDGTDRGPDHAGAGFVSESEYEWLKIALSTDKPVIIFTHHTPLPTNSNLIKWKDTQAFLSQYPNIALVVSGHDPACRFENMNNVNYFVTSGLTRADALGSFSTIDASYNKHTKQMKIDLKQHGAQERSFEIKKGAYPKWLSWLE